MFRHLFNRIMRRKLISGKDYGKSLARYRRQYPESLEEEKKRIHEWILFIEKRKREHNQVSKEARAHAEENKVAEALHRMRETARAAFMSHPAATEIDFRRCWPSIREELLKQHALEELAGNPILTKRLLGEIVDGDDILGIADLPYERRLQLLEKAEDSN